MLGLNRTSTRFRRSAPGIAADTRACGDAQYVGYLRGSLLRNEVMIASKESNLMTYQGLQVRAEEMGITRRWAAWDKCSAEGHYFGTTATNPPLRYCQRCFTAWSWRSESDPPLNEPLRQQATLLQPSYLP